MYSVRFQGSCSPTDDYANAMIANNQQDQRLLGSLNRHPESVRMLRTALGCKNVDESEEFDFGKIPLTASNDERCLLRCIRHTLQDFVSKYRRSTGSIPSNHERKIFFDGVMPVINYFADNSGSVYFEWCVIMM